MRTTMQLQLVSGAIALVLGAASVWGQAKAPPTSGGPVDPLLLEDLALFVPHPDGPGHHGRARTLEHAASRRIRTTI